MSKMFIISGPSGAGEDSLINGLIERGLDIERVVTTTSRAKREGESDGSPYYFVSKEDFKRGISGDGFFEWAQEYNENYYGVTREEIKRVQECGKIGIWKIGYKGVRTAKEIMPEVKAILVNAPLDVIEARIRRRDVGVSEEFIKDRMRYTEEWLRHKYLYDVEVMNLDGKLDEAISKVVSIIKESDG